MNILVVAAYGLYEDYSSSFVHSQIKAYIQAGHRVRAVIPVAFGKKSGQFGRISSPVIRVKQDGAEIFYLRCLSLSGYGEHGFNPMAAEKAVELYMDRLLEGFAPDIIHAHAILFAGRLGVRFKKRCGAPLVITTHGGDTDVSLTPEQNERARIICDQADRIIAVSPAYEKKTGLIGTKTPVGCILNGFNAENTVIREKKPYSLLQVSSFIGRKHTDLTIQAAAVLKKEYPDLTLTLVGDGEKRQELEKLCRELNATDYVNFTGFLSNPETMGKMAESEIFILPSTEEGFGIVYIEAMASGCVTIGTQGEGIDGVIKHGENGYLVKPRDADSIAETVRYCFDHSEEAGKAAARGKNETRKLTWQYNAQQYLRLFDSLSSL